jgi:hypothetical protein
VVNEPALLVALPAAVRELLGREKLADVSGLLAEWSTLLDPPAALAAAAASDADRLRDWRINGRAAVSSSVMKQLRDAARREDVARVLAALTPERDSLDPDPRVMPFLVGLAVAASIRAGAGVLSHGLREALKAQRRDEAERRSARGASEAKAEATPSTGDGA